MENRTDNQVEDILDFILDKFDLSVTEEELVESFLEILRKRDIKKQEQLTYLLDDETECLLQTIKEKDIKDFAEKYLDMVDEDDIEDCKKLKDYNDDDLLDEVESRDLNWQDYDSDMDIVTQSQLEEMTEKFLNLSIKERDNLIKSM
jgi:hypothetical protein